MRIPPARRQQLLLEAAFRVMSRDGVAAATTRAVCAEAGMPLASFHYVFESQKALMAALITSVVTRESEHVHDFEVTDDHAADIEALLLSTFDFVRAHPGEELALLELGHYAARTRGLEDLVGSRHEVSLGVVGGVLDKLEAKHGPLHTDRELLAQMVITVVEGNTVTWLGTRDDEACLASMKRFAVYLADLAYPVS
ncbi:TetR family transcriptional regulator [Enemella dayhoffiae]|uniref:TetR family transcriptional regulator n=1 Tax=Enemella dayhoffiae TaxID=2016507 RepID=A0A255GS09_9ACTN|nr:TetR family transcriptional regulator [Enemella dayhoffiae]OYO18599.1 TetR family transcriptional regulator [Enemella dayhoffiae]